MKNRTQLSKLLLTVLLLTGTIFTYAQTPVNTADPGSLQVGVNPKINTISTPDKQSMLKAIICPAGNFELDAASSLTDPATLPAGVTREWKWEEVKTGGTPSIIKDFGSAANANKLTQADATSLSNGYHTFRVTTRFKNQDGSAFCPSQIDEFTIFVLPKLTITAQQSSTDNTNTSYCATAVPQAGPSSKAIKLNATVTFDPATALNGAARATDPSGTPTEDLTNPVVGDFQFQFTWYKVDAATTFDPANPGTVTPVDQPAPATTTNVTTHTHTISSSENAVGSFKYYVAVNYTVNGCSNTLGTATVNGTTGSPLIINVIPQPGKPTITIK